MPRPGPRRPLVAVRLSQEDLAGVDGLAAARGVSRSDVIREAVRRELAREQRRKPRELPGAVAERSRHGK